MNSKTASFSAKRSNDLANINDTKLLPSLRRRCRLADGGEQKANKTKTIPTNTLTDYEQIKHYRIIDNILFVVFEFIGTV